MEVEIRYLAGVSNADFRDKWVQEKLGEASNLLPNSEPELLDVGAGSSPYKNAAKLLGFSYKSHDFNSYIPSTEQLGLQNETWEYSEHNFVCDILELPSNQLFDVVLCTEVLEHVPDPIRAFEKITSLVRPGGYVIVTVPFLSLMHQAPFWFQSGLSPFWFKHWAPKCNMEIVSLEVQGDYADLMEQEFLRVQTAKQAGSTFPILHKIFAKLLTKTAHRIRKNINSEVLESGGFGTLFVGKKQVENQ